MNTNQKQMTVKVRWAKLLVETIVVLFTVCMVLSCGTRIFLPEIMDTSDDRSNFYGIGVWLFSIGISWVFLSVRKRTQLATKKQP